MFKEVFKISLMLVSTFSERLKEALGDCSATEFAEKISMSKQTISAYLTEKRKPKKPTLATIAKALNVNEAWLLGYNSPKERNDYFISMSDIPHFLSESIKRWDNSTMSDFLRSFMSEDEISMFFDYRSLSVQGRDFMRQTMVVALNTYKQDTEFADDMPLHKQDFTNTDYVRGLVDKQEALDKKNGKGGDSAKSG